MNDKIEEILDKLYLKFEKAGLTAPEYSDLRYYITNLQAELQEANDSITWWSNRFKAVERDNEELKQENESLRARIKTIKRLRRKQTQKKNKYKAIIFNEEKALHNYKSRCEKASEYINCNKHENYDFEICLWEEDIDNLLNILQNGSEK